MADWRTIEQLAARVGAYCWAEHQLFALTGRWSADPAGGPEASLFLAAASRRHGALAERWYQHLPKRAGLVRGELVVAPPGPVAPAFVRLAAEADPAERLAALVEVVLTRLVVSYDQHLGLARPASEGPVWATLGPARREGLTEITSGHTLWKTSSERGTLADEIERSFGRTVGIIPGARPS